MLNQINNAVNLQIVFLLIKEIVSLFLTCFIIHTRGKFVKQKNNKRVFSSKVKFKTFSEKRKENIFAYLLPKFYR